MEFEDMMKQWANQPIVDAAKLAKRREKVRNDWAKHKRKTLISNVCVTIGFVGCFVVFAWVYLSFRQGYGPLFDISILLMYALLIVYLFVTWKGYSYRQSYAGQESLDYVNHQIAKLKWQRKNLTTYSLVYTLLLWLLLCCYLYEITHKGTWLLQSLAYGLSTAYIVGITWWARKVKVPKTLVKIDDMMNDLEAIREELEKMKGSM